MHFDTQNKDYRNDLDILINKLKNKEHFAFSKYADGELHILIDRPINNGEFWFVPDKHQDNRKSLIDSFQFQDESYYVGVSCPCCIGGTPVHEWMKKQSGQPESHLTWANLFVNGNYNHYLQNMVPLYSEYDVYLVSNSNSNLDRLPFEIKGHFQIGKNAWVENHSLIQEMKDYISDNEIKNSLFLFCAGPFGNTLTHQLYEYSKENTFIDIGSTLNPFLLGENGKNRGYLRSESSINKVCAWGE